MKAIISKRKRPPEVGFLLAPMIDVTFLLLIFFMVTTKITKQQVLLDIDLPIASAGILPEDLSSRTVINVDQKGQIYLGELAVNQAELQSRLYKLLQAKPDQKIYVRADSESDVKEIKLVMQTCGEAGATEVIFGSYRSN